MRVYIGPYRDWIGPYQIADMIFFWTEKYPENEKVKSRWDYRMRDALGPWLAETWVAGFCKWVDSKKKRDIRVHIDHYDTWGMDHTLALIILPMLKQLRDTKKGSPYVEPEDCPHIPVGEPTDFGYSDDKIHERWDWVLDEMIYAFEAETDEDWDDKFGQGEARDADRKRRQNGRILFGKYYGGLWD